MTTLAKTTRGGRRTAGWIAAVVLVAGGAWHARPSVGSEDAAGRGAAISRAAARVELGRRLFFDQTVSRSGRQSCATCHLPEHGFSDPRTVSPDESGSTRRHSQTILFADRAPGVHWDGEFDDVEALAFGRLVDLPTSFAGLAGVTVPARRDSVIAQRRDGRPTTPRGTTVPYYSTNGVPIRPVVPVLEEQGLYGEAFRAAYGDERITTKRLAESIADYVASVRPGRSAFDRYVGGDDDALSPAARRGLDLFRGRAGCAECHKADGRDAAFTDFRFHDTGLAWRGAGAPVAKSAKEAVELGDGGRMLHTHRDRDARAFKTPTLRDVELRPPYMHDGSLQTLREVVEYYADDTVNAERKDPSLDHRLKAFSATARDVDDLVEFLKSLTGEARAGMAPCLWSARAETVRLRVLGPGDAPLRLAPVQVTPAGDLLPGHGAAEAEGHTLRTDEEGWLSFSPFLRTHVTVSVGLTSVTVPDTCAEATIRLQK